MKRTATIVMVLLVALTKTAMGADFYLYMDECRTVAGLLGHADEGNLRVLEGTPTATACTRVSDQILCQIQFQDGGEGAKGPTASYKVKFDFPPELHFTDENFSDYYVINTVRHAVVLITRMVTETAVGSKVCHGLYVTESERNALMKAPEK